MVDRYTLTPKQRKMMEVLESSDVVSTQQIQQDVFGWPGDLAGKVDYSAVRMTIMRLKKVGIQIETVRGYGFRLIK